MHVFSLDKLEYHAGDVMKLRLQLDPRPGIKPRISHLSLQVCLWLSYSSAVLFALKPATQLI